jgi:hypothetical protein
MKSESTKCIGLFLPTTNPFYVSLFYSLKRAFGEIGVEVGGGTELLGENELSEFVRQFKPDALLEMNRSREQIPFLPDNIRHISWMVDVADWPYEKISGSDIIYFFGANWYRNFPNDSTSLVRWFPPGMCPDTYHYAERNAISDTSFIGHIPRPWESFELDRVVGCSEKGILKFADLFDECIKRWQVMDLSNFDNEAYLRSAVAIASEMLGTPVTITDQKLRYDISCRSIRIMNRKKLMRLALKSTDSMRIFGSPYWSTYPEFAPYYMKFLNDPNEIRNAYQTTRVNLHEGVGLHNRTFDCMGAGGVLFHYRSPDDDEYGGINTFFDPDVHYVSFDERDYEEKFSHFVQDQEKRKKMGRAAAELVHANHTWKHRALQVMADINEC